MNIFEIMMICIGLSLDVFAVCVCEGSMLMKIKRNRLICMGAIFCLWQLVAIETGNFISLIPIFRQVSGEVQKIWQVFSAIIFFVLGIYMLYKAWKKEIILEQRSEINYKKVCMAAMITSLDALFADIGIGFLGSSIYVVAIMILIITYLFVILGIYTGYRLGYEQKTKVYWAGGIILMIAGIDVIIRYLVL